MSNNHTSTPIMKTNSHLMKIGRREFAARNMWHNYHKHEAKAGLWPARPSGQLTLRLWKWSSFVTNTKTDKHFIIIYKSSSSYVIFASHWKGFGGNRRYGNDYGSTDGSGGGNFFKINPLHCLNSKHVMKPKNKCKSFVKISTIGERNWTNTIALLGW